MRLAVVAIGSLVVAISASGDDSDPTLDLSRGKPYFLLPAPSYWGCTDAGDASQLTDGEKSNGHWLDTACVGWSEGGRQVAVLIDLEQQQVFDTILLSTLRGEFAGVLPPLSVRVYVSDDGERFRQVAEQGIDSYDYAERTMVEQESGQSSERLVLRLSGFATEGRFVLVTMERGNFLFLDEVSVLRRGDQPAAVTDGKIILNKEITSRYLGVPEVFDPDIEPFETPHWPVAKQLAGGPIDALMVIPVATSRDWEELRQRLDLDGRVIATDEGPDSPMNGLLQVRIARELGSHRPEVLILAGTRWEELSEDLRQVIVEQVQSGMGLVLIDPRLNLEKLRDLGLPLNASMDPWAMRLRTNNDTIPMHHGQGRVVLIDEKGRTDYASHTMISPPLTPLGSLTSPVPLDSEYAYSRVARAVHWAARAESGSGDRGLKSVAFDAPNLTVTADIPGRVRVEVRNAFNELVYHQELEIGTGEQTAIFELPVLPGGTLHTLVQKLDAEGGVEDWRCVRLEQSPPVSIGSINAPHSIAGRADAFAAVVQINRANRDEGDRLRLLLIDTHGRVVHDRRHALPIAPDITVDIDHPDLLSRAVCLRAVVERDGMPVDEQRRWVLVREPDRLDESFRLDFWTGGNPMAFRHHVSGIYEQTRRLGADGLFGTWPMQELCNLAAKHDISIIPENILRIYEEPGSTSTHRVPTLGTPDFHAQLESRINQAIETYGPFGIELASLGDECSYATSMDSDRSPAAIALFQEWLESRFGTIDELNRAYGLQLSSFSEAVPPLTAEAAQAGDYGLWLAHREFSVHQFSKTMADATEIFRQTYPDTPFGISGSQLPSASNGHDYAELADTFDAISAYGSMQRELLRSLADSDNTHTVWSGFDYSNSNERLERYNIWLALMEGFKGIALFHQFEQRSHALYSSGYIGPDLRPHRRATWMRDTVADIRDAGLGHLVGQSRSNNQSIGVLYSTRSLMLMNVGPVRAEGYLNGGTLYLDAVGGMTEALRDLHRPFVFIDESRLGAIDPAATGMLLIPSAISLSDEALNHLDEYVRRGGTIVCGLNTGRYDAFGQPRSSEDLQEKLGVIPTFTDTMAPLNRIQPDTIQRGQGAILNLGASLFDYAPTTVGGVGGELINQGGSSARQAVLRQALEEAIAPLAPRRKVAVRGTEGGSVNGIEVFPMEADGGYRFLGLLGAYSKPGLISSEDRLPITVDLRQPGVVYELVTGKDHGRSGSIETALASGEARFFAVLPHEVAELHASATQQKNRITVEAEVVLTDNHTPGLHAIRVKVTDPSGRLRPEYGGVLLAPEGRVTHGFELAMNDPVGEWIISVRDTISQRSAQTVITTN